MGHELRTPLTNIKGFASTLANHGARLRQEMRDDAAQSILQNGERLERLIEDLLYVSRVENHRPPLHLAWDDVVAIAADVVASCARRHEGRSILIDGPGNDLPIYTDRVKVEQILTHLIENAVKYSAEGTDVRVRILASVRVSDAHRSARRPHRRGERAGEGLNVLVGPAAEVVGRSAVVTRERARRGSAHSLLKLRRLHNRRRLPGRKQ
ncbi:MAG: hypothetical protein E6G04_07895 [Actinobacteria bacterium]|nr:MAG: hypothetical protein E6G04_07895 [Actinomycetota bacterium]